MAPETRRRALELVSRLRHLDKEMAEATIEMMDIMANAGKEDFAVIEKEYDKLFRDRQERMALVVQSNAARKVGARRVDDTMRTLGLMTPEQSSLMMRSFALEVTPLQPQKTVVEETDPLDDCECGHEARYHGDDVTFGGHHLCRKCDCDFFKKKQEASVPGPSDVPPTPPNDIYYEDDEHPENPGR